MLQGGPCSHLVQLRQLTHQGRGHQWCYLQLKLERRQSRLGPEVSVSPLSISCRGLETIYAIWGEGYSPLSSPSLQQQVHHSQGCTHVPLQLLPMGCHYLSDSHPSRTSYTSQHRQIPRLASIHADCHQTQPCPTYHRIIIYQW